MHSPPTVPDHTLLRLIGRGSYGEVWLARNVMGALRAVKVVARRRFESDRPYEREFAGIQRFEPVSRCADGLVHVLHVGRNEAEECFYYVMELADAEEASGEDRVGVHANESRLTHSFQPLTSDSPNPAYSPRTLSSDLRRLGRLPTADCLRLALDVVSGLARLHECGLVHRDVKPGNIIYVEGRAKLADMGLVSKGGEGRTFVGTEGYIPPEGPGSEAADLYALGMVLYEAATGYPPDKFPKVPPEWFADDACPESLEFHEIVLKACEGAKEQRYRRAGEMQADLAYLQSGQSIRKMHALERRVRGWRIVGWVAAIAIALAVATALVANWRTGVEAKNRANETRLKAQAQSALGTALFEQARALVLSKELGHRTRALDALRQAGSVTNHADMRRVAFAALSVPDLRLEHEIRIEPNTTLVRPDPAFARVALCRGSGPVTLRSLPGFELIATLSSSSNNHAYVALWSGDGQILAVKRELDQFGTHSNWEIWKVTPPYRVLTVRPDVSRNAFAFHPRRPLVVAGHLKGHFTEWDIESGSCVREFYLPCTPYALAYSPDGLRLAAIHQTAVGWALAILDAATLEVQRSMEWPEGSWLSWHPDGRWITAIADQSSAQARGVYLIDADTGGLTRLGEHKIKAAINTFTGDGKYLISGGWDREIYCWDLRTSQRMFTHAGTGYQHYWSADGSRCAMWLPENILQLFSFERPSCHHLADNPGDTLRDGQFSPDGRWLVARDDRHLCVWDVSGSAPPAVLPTPRRQTAFFSPDSTELFAVPEEFSQQGFLGRWRLNAGAKPESPPEASPLPMEIPKGLLRAAVASNELVMTSAEGVRFVALTNLASGKERVVRIPPGLGYISPDARKMAVVYQHSPAVRVYSLPDLKVLAMLKTGHIVTFITFSPNSDEMLLLNRGGVEWFDTSTWRRTRRQPGTPVTGSYAFYTPDGERIWMVTHFRNAAMIDRRTLDPILPLPNNVLPLAVTPNGRRLAVSVEGHRVQLWDMLLLRQELSKLGLDWNDR